MAITGASRKQAGLYYDKGGAVFNMMHPDYGYGNTTPTATFEQALLSALDDADGVGTVLVPGRATPHSAGAAIALPSNSHIEIASNAVIQMSTRLDALFTATSQSNIHISGRGKVKGTGTHYAVDVSKLFYFSGCSDVSLIGPELSLSVWGAHFETCTDWDFNCVVKDISDTTDGSQGYGILASLENIRYRIAGRFKNIGRHAIYISAGPQDGVIDDVVINDCYNTGIVVSSSAAQTRIKNLSFGSVVMDNVGIVADSNGCSGIGVFSNCENIAISSGVVMNNIGTDGIHIEGAAAGTPATNPVGITIDCPIISDTGAKGISLINVSEATIAQPRLRDIGTTGILVTITGADTGSFTDDVHVNSYDINGAATGLSFSGDSALTNCSFGWGHLRNCTAKFNIPATNTTLRYTGPTHTWTYSELTVTASQTNNAFVANPAADHWGASETGYITELYGRYTGTLTAGTLTITVSKDGSAIASLQASVAIGENAFFARIPLGALIVVKGSRVGVMYTTNAGFLPINGNIVACVVYAPYP